ncbi:MAG: hypothetical protein Q4A32_06495 [Lachnospiraceae bacterium]|nr:hypothetical protein [Lachnospiraceae bacterium]
MADSEFKIRVKRGHLSKLRFWFDPMSQEILDGDADLIYPDELSCDKLYARDFVFPFIERFFPGEFKFRNELNLMPFENVRELVAEMRACIDLLDSGDFDNPRLNPVRDAFTLDSLVPGDEYDDKYFDLSSIEKHKIMLEHLDVVSTFYTTICDYLDEMIEKYEPQGFEYIAISTPS